MMTYAIGSTPLDVGAFALRKGRLRGARNTNATLKDNAAEEGASLVVNSNITRKQAAEQVISKYRLMITVDTMSRVIARKLQA